MKKTVFLTPAIILFLLLKVIAQTGSYNQTAPNIYSVNSYTNVTFTNTPYYASSGTLAFSWIACHQPGFGASTVNVDLLTSTGYQNIASYSSSLDCSSISQSKSLSGSQLSDAVVAGAGNIIFRFYISDGCQAGVGCASINDPAVIGINLTYPYSIADFTVSDTTLCPGQTITFTDITPGTVNSRNWSFPGGSPSSATGASPSVTYNTPGWYNVTLTTTGPGGSNTTTKTALLYVYTPPVATITPGGPVTFCNGGSVNLQANTGPGLSYTWKKSGNIINGASNASYSATTSANYKVVVTSSDGCSTTSAIVTVTVNANPTAIISANGPVTFCPGGTVTLQALTGGGFTYKWKKNNVLISGATTSSYAATTSGNYSCKVTNGNGCSSSSNTIGVTVNTPKATLTLSGNATFCQGGSALLKANTGSGLTYQWIRNGANISGAADSAYTVTVSGNYKVKVTNNCGSSTSTVKTITVNSLPSASISANGPLTFCSGSTVTLNANTGTGLTYVWKKNNSTISGATGSSYVASTQGSYKVVVTNASGCTAVSNTLTVAVNATIASITPGGPLSFCSGDSVVLTANSGAGLTYQWLKNNTNISGATSISHTAKTAGTYKVIVTNSTTGCAAISSGLSVTVNCKISGTGGDFHVLVVPNPFTYDFLVTFENFSQDPLLGEVYSMTGQLLSSQVIPDPQNGFRTGQDLPAGIYLLKIRQGTETRNMSLVKGK